MQIKYLHKSLYTISKYALRHLNTAKKVTDPQVEQWTWLRSEGISEKLCQQITGISRATYYRRKSRLSHGLPTRFKRSPKHRRKPGWTKEEINQVLRIRRENPTYGKAKIHHILKRDEGFTKSQSTVGRILTHLKSKGLLTRSFTI